MAPTLKRRDIVVIDNLPAHRVLGVDEVMEAVGASLLYLPQYSPDLNPIEMVFHSLKSVLRKAAERTIAGLSRRRSFQIFTRTNAWTTSDMPAMHHFDRKTL